MAIADTRTLLPLDTFAKYLGIDGLHFNAVELKRQASQTQDSDPINLCGLPTLQYDWQGSDAVSREQIAQVISDAEEEISQALGFKPGLTWELDERVDITKPSNPNLLAINGLNLRGQAFSLQPRWGYILSGGTEAKSLIQAGATVGYTATGTDAYKNLATVTVATSVTDPDEIAVYYPGESAADAFEIRPISVAISGGTATITFQRAQAVLWNLLSGYNPVAVDGYDDTQFLATVDVYRHYNDGSQMIQWEWEGLPMMCSCGQTSCPSCNIDVQTGCFVVRDGKLPIIAGIPATYDSTTGSYSYSNWTDCRNPDRARVWYRAGMVDPRLRKGEVPPRYGRAIAYMAAARLDRPLCSCSNIESMIQYWAEDKALDVDNNNGQRGRFQNTRKLLDTPFGTKRGELQAWELIRPNRLGTM